MSGGVRELKEQLYAALWAKRRLQVTRSFYEFFLDAFEVITGGEPLQPNWHVRHLCDLLQTEMERWRSGAPKTRDIVINIPPRTLKSSIVSVAFPAWCWASEPTMKFIGSSYSATLSVDLNLKTRRLIESQWYQAMFGEQVKLTSDQNAKGYFENSRGGFRKSTSTGGSVTGTGADVIIVDDPQDPMRAASKADRELANEYFDSTLSTRLNHPNQGYYVIIMQRLHQMDLTGHLLTKEPHRWQHTCLPAEDSMAVQPPALRERYKGGLLFPDRLTGAILSDYRTRLGSYNYAGQFKQLPADPEGGIIKRAWFKQVTWPEAEQLCHLRGISMEKVVWEFFLDTAYTEDSGNDQSAILCAAAIGGDLFIRCVEAVRLEFPELIRMIPSFVQRHGYSPRSRIHVEPKASGKSVVQQLRRTTGLNIMESPPPKDDKVSRVTAIAPPIEAGRVYLIDGTWMDSYLDEVCEFPRARFDDRVDVTVMAVGRLLGGGITKPAQFSFAGGG